MQDRLDLYLQQGYVKTTAYVNTEEENELVNKFNTLYSLAKSAQDNSEECSASNLTMWRQAYEGVLPALTQEGTVSKRKSRQLRKMVYELVESKVDNSIPLPKMSPRYKSDKYTVDITESFLKYEVDRILTRYVNDASERATYIDGTCWYKVSWDSMDNTHERNGDVKIDLCLADQIVPQPGVKDYKQLEYIFERREISASKIYDLYNKIVLPNSANTNMVNVISCYYLNEDHIVGLFMWCPDTMQVICNEHDWQIRKLRVCTHCGNIVPQGDICGRCGHKHFKYENATDEVLDEDLVRIYNPYEEGETTDRSKKDDLANEVFLSAGTIIPFYRITQLPFVPRPNVSRINSIYGISDVAILLEEQDAINKILTKAVDKTLKSGSILTKPDNVRLGDKDDTFKILSVKTAEQATMVQNKQVVADTSQDVLISNLLYDSAKSASGITDSFQGKRDTTATSGKAKQYAAAQSAGRIESTRVMKAAVFAGLYELVLKYLLAFSDEPRSFVKILPDGESTELTWNKYMFLAKDKYDNIYYRDDFSFNTDPAATLEQNRVQMWQETQDKFMQGSFGNPSDPRTLELYWNVLGELQYPLSKVALAGIKANAKHLPPEIEAQLINNPELLQQVVSQIEAMGEQRGGARDGAGRKSSGYTHNAQVAANNDLNASRNKTDIVQAAQQMGGTK